MFLKPSTQRSLQPTEVIADSADLMLRIDFTPAIESIWAFPYPIELCSFPFNDNNLTWKQITIDANDLLVEDGTALIITVTNSELYTLGILGYEFAGVKSASYDATLTTDSDRYDILQSSSSFPLPYPVELKVPARSEPSYTEGLLIQAKANSDYLGSGGANYLEARTSDALCRGLTQDQANWLYVSGHGDSSTGAVDGVLPSHVDWGKGLNVVIFSACSVLDVYDMNGNYSDPKSPGVLWAGAGPSVLLGYNYESPLDNGPDGLDPNFTADIVTYFLYRRYLRMQPLCEAWGYANKDKSDSRSLSNPFNSCAIEITGTTRTYWYWQRTGYCPACYYTWVSVTF